MFVLFLAVLGLGCCASLSLVAVQGLLDGAAPLLLSVGSRAHRLLQRSAGSMAVSPGSRARAQELRHPGLAALQYVKSSQTRD